MNTDKLMSARGPCAFSWLDCDSRLVLSFPRFQCGVRIWKAGKVRPVAWACRARVPFGACHSPLLLQGSALLCSIPKEFAYSPSECPSFPQKLREPLQPSRWKRQPLILLYVYVSQASSAKSRPWTPKSLPCDLILIPVGLHTPGQISDTQVCHCWPHPTFCLNGSLEPWTPRLLWSQ